MKLGVALAALFIASCSGNVESAANRNVVLVGSTACDAPIKSAVGIPAEVKCDFIRWNLALDPTNANAFKLELNYGEGQPNTLGFIGGGQKISASGKVETISRPRAETPPGHPVSQTAAAPDRGGERGQEIYRLKSERPAVDISLLKLNENLFQLLMPDGTMMIGNAGWSYTLNRSTPLPDAKAPAITFAKENSTKAVRTVFEGRTPCSEIAGVFGTAIDASCFKLKWRLTLYRDPTTLEPTTFTIESTFSRKDVVKGRWSIMKTAPTDATRYRLEPEAPAKSFSLLLAEDNILFLLDSSERPLVGNKDFSYTLNRRSDR